MGMVLAMSTPQHFAFTLLSLSQSLSGVDRDPQGDPGILLPAICRHVIDRVHDNADNVQVARCRAWRRHLVLQVGKKSSGDGPGDYRYTVSESRPGKPVVDTKALARRHPAFYAQCQLPAERLRLVVPSLALPPKIELHLDTPPADDAAALPYGSYPSAHQVEVFYDRAKERMEKRKDQMARDRETIMNALEGCICDSWDGTEAVLADGAVIGVYQVRFAIARARELDPELVDSYTSAGKPIVYVNRVANRAPAYDPETGFEGD